MKAGHLARRFFGSLRPGGPGASAEVWVASVLGPGELALWKSMNGPDRRHAYGVARRVEVALGDEATPPVLAAALLHDAGKVESHLRTLGRVVATLAGRIAGPERALEWAEDRGYARKVGRYLLHAEIGAEHLTDAGSEPLTVAWAREHHLPEEQWTVPLPVARVLKACDDD